MNMVSFEHMRPLPLVSIIITTYNAEQFLEDTLQSIASQTYSNLEVVIIDDGSVDNTPSILSSFQSSYPALNINTSLEPHKGRIAALNQGIELAQGELIAICDADDNFLPNKIARQVALFLDHPRLGLCGSDAHAIDERGTRHLGHRFMKCWDDASIRHNIVGYNPFIHSSVMYRKTALPRNKPPYLERFLPGFELELYITIMKTWDAMIIPEKLVEYRFHSQNLTKKRKRLSRLVNVTRARWFVYLNLEPPYRHWIQLFAGFFDLLPRSHRL